MVRGGSMYERYDKDLIKSVLLNTGSFHEIKGPAEDIADLRASGIDTLLLSSCCLSSFYLFNENHVIIRPNESDLLVCPPIPLRVLKLEDIKELPRIDGIPHYDWNLLAKLVSGEKYIILSRIREPRVVRGLIRQVKGIGLDPLDICVVPLEIYLNRENDIDTFLAGLELRKRGYLITFRSFGMAGGDLFAYKVPGFAEGAFLLEVLLGKKLKRGLQTEESTCIVEVEAQTRILDDRHGIKQVLKYVFDAKGYFGKAFVAASLAADYQIRACLEHKCGVITFDRNGNIVFKDALYDWSDREKQHELLTSIRKLIELIELRNEKCPIMRAETSP